MSVFASLLRTAYRVSGAKKAFALPEDKIVPVIEKQTGRFSDLGKLAAVEENVLHGKLGLRQKGHGKVGPDGGSHHQRQPRYAAAAQKFLHLTHLIVTAAYSFPPIARLTMKRSM